MKKVGILAFVCAAALLSGCGNGEGSQKEQSAQSPSASATDSESSEGDVSYVAMLPSIEETFPDGEVTVIDSDGGSGYCVQVTGYKDGEYDKYIAGCKSKGFTDVRFDINEDSNSSFEARTEDGKYYVSLQLLKDERQVLTITCGTRKTS